MAPALRMLMVVFVMFHLVSFFASAKQHECLFSRTFYFPRDKDISLSYDSET